MMNIWVETENAAGTESMAKSISEDSTTKSTAKRGVAKRLPLTLVKKLCPSKRLVIGMIFLIILKTGLFCKSCFWLSSPKNIFSPLIIKIKPKKYSTNRKLSTMETPRKMKRKRRTMAPAMP